MDDKNRSAIDKVAEGLSGADVRGRIRFHCYGISLFAFRSGRR